MANKNYRDRRRIMRHMQLKGYSYEEALERYNNMMESLKVMQAEGIDTDAASVQDIQVAFDLYQQIKGLI